MPKISSRFLSFFLVGFVNIKKRADYFYIELSKKLCSQNKMIFSVTKAFSGKTTF